MDYWNYLAHSQGSERAGHRYYARELVGNSGGRNQYRYFYTAEEYAAYKNGKGTPGRGTYAENGTSRNATVWPAGTADARRRAEARNHVEQQKAEMDRNRHRTNVRAQKVQMDAERYRRQRREDLRAKRAQQKAEMDRARNNRLRGEKHSQRVASAIAERVKRDAEAYRAKRQGQQDRRAKQDAINARRIGEQHSADRKRWARENAASIGEQHSADRKRWNAEAIAAQVKRDAARYRHKKATENVRREKIKMDAKRYRRQRHQAANERVRNKKRIMDNIRQRPYYQPTIKR